MNPIFSAVLVATMATLAAAYYGERAGFDSDMSMDTSFKPRHHKCKA